MTQVAQVAYAHAVQLNVKLSLLPKTRLSAQVLLLKMLREMQTIQAASL